MKKLIKILALVVVTTFATSCVATYDTPRIEVRTHTHWYQPAYYLIYNRHHDVYQQKGNNGNDKHNGNGKKNSHKNNNKHDKH